jgi:YidC/Oxa1 family membrane protein insertase
MDARNRFLYIAVLIGLALAVPYLLAPPSSKQPAGQTAQGRTDAKPATAPKAATQAPAQAPAMRPEEARARKASERLATIETDRFLAQVTNLNGGLRRFTLKGENFRTSGKPLELVTTDKEEYLPLAIELGGLPMPATWELTQLGPTAVLITGEAEGVHVTRKLQAGEGPYQLWLTTHVENRGTEPRKLKLNLATHHYVEREQEGSTLPLLPAVRSAATSGAVCRHAGDIERFERDALTKQSESFSGEIAFAGVENVYFLKAVAPDSAGAERCLLTASGRGVDEDNESIGTLFNAKVSFKEARLDPGQSRTYRALAYLGPKSPDELAAAGHSLKSAIQSGWFTSLAEGLTWLLSKIHDFVGNWGVAIILLTFIVKLVLFPLTLRQMQSMARMKELKPELDRINELYGDDREKKGAAIMELYRKRKVNPMAGCFPVLLQLPIWFSLYASLSSNVELFHAPFALWWRDLSSPDQYFVLPLALGVLMFVQQKMSPATGMDPVQQKVMLYMMPAIVTSFMLFLPAGLCLYMFTNSALSILQQRMIEAQLRKTGGQSQPGPGSTDQPPSQQAQAPAISTISPSRELRTSGRPSKAERRLRRGKR